MKVMLAETAGFCYGVCRAVELAEEAAARGGAVAMLGPLIHNRQVVSRLEEQGVRLIRSPEEAPAPTCGPSVCTLGDEAAPVPPLN